MLNILFMTAKGFSCCLDVLYGGLGISKWNFWLKKGKKNFSTAFFLQFLVIKTLDTDWIRIRIRIHLKCWITIRIQWFGSTTLLQSLDPDPHWGKMLNLDPHWHQCESETTACNWHPVQIPFLWKETVTEQYYTSYRYLLQNERFDPHSWSDSTVTGAPSPCEPWYLTLF